MLASPAQRGFALILDFLLVLGIALAPFYLGLFGDAFRNTNWIEPDDVGTLFVDGLLLFPVLAVIAVQFVGSGLLHGLLGRTPGKFLMGTKLVRRKDGHPLQLKGAFSRAGFSVLSVIFLGAGFFWLFVDRKQRALHDYFAGTAVVRAS